MTGIFAIAGSLIRTPGAYTRVDPDTGRPTRKALRNTMEYIHPSLRARLELEGPGTSDRGIYECRALDDYKLRVTDAKAEDHRPIAVWESRAKRKGQPKKVLAESPLFETELKLLRLASPEVYDVLYEQRSRPNR